MNRPLTGDEFFTIDRGLFAETMLITEADMHGLGDECVCIPIVTRGANIQTQILHNRLRKENTYGTTNNDGSRATG